MAALSGSGELTRSQIENWDVKHLETAATYWSSTAQLWEDHFTAIHQGTLHPGGTVWEGDAAEAAQESTFRDLVKLRSATECLYSASSIATNGAGDLAWAKRLVLQTITEAEEAQFEVAEDLSVSDPTMTALMLGWEVRQAQAQEFTAEIASRARTLRSIDAEIAGKVTTALHPAHAVSFGEAPDEHTPVVYATGYRFKTDIEANDQDPLHHHGPETVHPGGTPPNGVDPETGAHVLPGEGEDGAGMREAPAASFPAPSSITGMTGHGAEQVQTRDGHGVNDTALHDAVAHPTEPPTYQPGRQVYLYLGKDATVVLNQDGQVVTAWPRNSNGWRNP